MTEKIHVLIDEQEINSKICELAEQINKDYEGKSLHLVCILKGSAFFACDLAKRLTVPTTIDFMSISSYGSGTVSSGIVRLAKDLDEPVEGKHLLVVEDIVDSGRTLSKLKARFLEKGAKEVKICTILKGYFCS